ncbi:rho GTPase-activating protein 20-like [Sceloporus undulatus]|uniref:rho GTPase-activating protein 20-like n=1 Tax=Sceloporus undulatus TaxID=8520 RepID=UPI001C4B6571|nr:rho GTPase-activating protein 20-like [Sceloporus undulatus]
MTPQQKGPWPLASPERSKKMKPIIQRRRSTSAAISRALSKSKYHSSREITLSASQPDNGLSTGAFGNPNSVFILDERIQLTLGLQTQERHLLLFSDVLVVAKSKSSSSLKLKKQVPLSEVWTSSCLGDVSEKKMNPETSFVIGWPTANYVVTCSSPEVKEKWLSTLQWHIEEAKQTEYPKTLPMQVFLMDSENSSSSALLSVSNMEVADDVIKKAAQQLGLPGRASDYHLWVLSGRDSPAYPLLGHEYPFSIILACLRDSMDQLQGTNNNLLLAAEYETFLLDHLPRDRQCQFILKPRPHAPVQLRRETLQKHIKRKKSLIDWALRRSSSTPTSSPASQSPTNPRKLFGLSLTSVCPDGSLPKPIKDILQLLYYEGPSTRGIFRRSANAKICKELKEKLNSGDEVRVDGESVFVAAAVITDFLRNIPNSVLSSEMHGLWMEAMDKENQAHKIEAIKSLVNQLPEANRILLRHLFGVLHHIEQNAIENQMNAFNLALCIAPNMLWLPRPTGPEEESKSTKKVAMLVQFLIENSAEIFGGDIASLFQRPERKKSKSVDDILVQRNDSSDEMEFAASYGERPEQHYLLEVEDGLFSPSGELLLSEHREDWDLFSEIDACYQSKARKNASADSYDLLEQEEEGGSFCSLGSACSLSPARDRCSSEPSVCLSSQLPSQDHEPVARQSSCDATIMRHHGDYIRRLKQLQLESQKLIDEGLSPGLSRAARPSFWRGPQSSHVAKTFGLQKTSLSNRSSFSSLSSTTTSPSASSLSSLDSAFSYCSESSAFSPADVSSLPFMFGTSARLHALSPKMAKRSMKEWHKPLTSPLPLSSCDMNFSFEKQEGDQESSGREETAFFVPIVGTGGSPPNGNGEKEECHAKKLPHPLGSCSAVKTEYRTLIPSPESNSLTGRQAQREKSVKHIEIKCPKDAPHAQGSLKRTKITVYMAPKERSLRESSEGQEDGYVVPKESNVISSGLSKSLQTVRVHIPQTVFYGQNTPLVLQSVARRYHHESMSHFSQVAVAAPQSNPLVEEPSSPAQEDGHHGKVGSKTFSHTFRIFLPASIRNTVREYFSHDGAKECCAASAETVEKELIRSRAEWLRGQPCAGANADERQGLMIAEETFV